MTQTFKQVTFGMVLAGLFLAFFLAIPISSHAMVPGLDRVISSIKANSSSTKPVIQVKDIKSMASTTKNASSTKPAREVKDLSCVQEAVLERETAIATAWTDFNTDMVSALTKRTDALVDAWKMTDAKERATALKKLWATWKTDSKKAHTDMRAERKDAWADFKKTMKEECKESKLPKEDAELKDASGAVTI